MPRAVKAKPKSSEVAKMAPKKSKKTYNMPEPIPLGEVLTDTTKNQWKIGPSIGTGGFGEIYSACSASKTMKNDENYNYVVKIEPHVNGPLFVEMHFYMRNAQQNEISKYIEKRGIKNLGIPYLVGSGSHELNGQKHRFLVLPRYGKDVGSLVMDNGNKMPEHTIYRLVLQMLEVYEFIHNASYVHGDLKSQNILLGRGKEGEKQAFLVDFGLATHYTKKDFKPDPKKMHNGTSDYTSRDAHQGVPTMRGDLEILGYNIVQWFGAPLPWEGWTTSTKVQQAKEEFMGNLDVALKKLAGKSIPEPIRKFLNYVSSLEYNVTPNYNKCKQIFITGLKSLGKVDFGALEFKNIPAAAHSKTKIKSSPVKNTKSPTVDSASDNEQISGTPQEERVTRTSLLKRKMQQNESPTRRIASVSSNSPKEPTEDRKKTKKSKTDVHTINFSAKESKTVININITPHNKKTYELDISADANLVVNIKKKKSSKTAEPEESNDNLQPRVRLRKYVVESALKTAGGKSK